MNTDNPLPFSQNVEVTNPEAASSVVLVCEHASHYIPDALHGLGLSPDDTRSHAAWDPGALPVAQEMSRRLDAALVAATVSRLVYDCNRPPEAPGAMTEQSEKIRVPGNTGLTPEQRDARTRAYYLPFRDRLAQVLAETADPVLVTVHSFTPVWHGAPRTVEIGVLHDSDSRLADALLNLAADHTACVVRRNDPYGPADGVTHTLKEHGLSHGRPNVMLEVRNDLIATPDQQRCMGAMLAEWLADACAALQLKGRIACRA